MLKNIIFDIGNVLLKWDPEGIIKKIFPGHPVGKLRQEIFKSDIWFDLNKGYLSEEKAASLYHEKYGIPLELLNNMLQEIKFSQTPIEGSLELVEELYKADIPLYLLSDNIKEIVAFLKERFTFFNQFRGIVISADLGLLKPDKKIYQHLLKTYDLNAEESLFIDDLQKNVEGAKAVGMDSFQFIDAASCREELRIRGVRSSDVLNRNLP